MRVNPHLLKPKHTHSHTQCENTLPFTSVKFRKLTNIITFQSLVISDSQTQSCILQLNVHVKPFVAFITVSYLTHPAALYTEFGIVLHCLDSQKFSWPFALPIPDKRTSANAMLMFAGATPTAERLYVFCLENNDSSLQVALELKRETLF